MKKLSHHSTSDWLFVLDPPENNGSWTLSTSEYISAPSSVEITNGAIPLGFRLHAALLNITDSQDIKEGQIITYYKLATSSNTRRPNIVIGALADLSAYQYHGIGSHTDWTRVKFKWWNSYNLLNEEKLACQYSYWSVDHWIDADVYYVERLSGGVNLCGVAASCPYRYYAQVKYDDTEVYKTS